MQIERPFKLHQFSSQFALNLGVALLAFGMLSMMLLDGGGAFSVPFFSLATGGALVGGWLASRGADKRHSAAFFLIGAAVFLAIAVGARSAALQGF